MMISTATTIQMYFTTFLVRWWNKKLIYNVVALYRMRELEQRRHPIHILSLRLFTVILLLIAFVLVRGVWGMYQKERETYTGRMQAETELYDMQERKGGLRAEIVRLRSPDGIEASLRSQFDMAKEGEGVIVIVDHDKTSKGGDVMDLRTVSTWKRIMPLVPWHLFGQ